ncbi:MAG: hypothetical protein IJX82_08275 [Clostridia bacterium]|nr:hypothetical protein [Clostridia bacterium]
MKCPTCGNEMNDLSSFCVECGTLNPKIFPPKQEPKPTVPPANTAQQTVQPSTDETPKPHSVERAESTSKKQKKNSFKPNAQTKMLAMITAFLCLIALVGFCMPMVTVNIFGARHATGIDILQRGIKTFDTPEVFSLFSLIAAAVGLTFGLYAVKNRTSFSAVLIASALSAIFMLMTLSDYMDYIGTGFILFEIAHCAIIILSIVALYSTNASKE